ncbi:sushi, von Willebrand factor type A, EGF and pentraxin domain-containing protein 1-like isoform X1 [Xenia sp. Carnegie-2017]|uniref:sushi, von Willebrand factor type A, EGF and pentraxin domain-containing protein 1-like isoform X1 n=1 Tax=Xenia sp. Carnegie-2017 TaxID=2897299 RepID=UPI001F03CFA9|nr:sushi, von Willebrand factor type A, EGF and pentraxin domain-containing protein 1-like isoform X1 [Xenia sp. Carnegie-2017]
MTGYFFLGWRFQGNVFKKIEVQNEIECIVKCFKEPCCQSLNHSRRLSQGRWSLCEMLHSVLNDSSRQNLRQNRFYDYVFFNTPIKMYNKSCKLQQPLNKSYDLVFPNAHVENLILLDNVMPNISEMTLAFWVNTGTRRRMALFSYAVQNSPDEFFVGFDTERVIITIKSLTKENLHIYPIYDGYWHHLVIILTLMTERIFLDGAMISNETMVNNSLLLLRGGGVVAIGQKLECENAVFDPNISFVSKINNLNLWNYDVTRNTSCTIKGLKHECTVEPHKQIIQWRDLHIFLSGNVSKSLTVGK